MNHIKLLFITSILFISCHSNKKSNQNEEEKDTVSIVKNERITSAPAVLLEKEASEEMKNWKAYQRVTELVKNYYNTTVFEALKNAPELVEATKILKDSIKVQKLEIPSVKARLNVLHNEALRLEDMSKIPSITDKEVKNEVQKMLKIYSAINAKINTIYRIEKYDIDI
ncbi:MAG: hypothetical protein KGV44_05675 [Flavobacteriaceae bacterium]|nr:hypothetical protein [Flavobacteriaceae bacterium]